MNDAKGTGQKNTIKIDVGSNPALKQYFTNKPDGEKCTLEVEMLKTGMTDDMVEGSVVSIAPEDYEEPVGTEEKPGGEVVPSSEEPVMMMVGGGGGPKYSAKAA